MQLPPSKTVFLYTHEAAHFQHNLVLAGHTRSLDVATISQGNTKFFSVLMLAWGMQVYFANENSA